VKQLESGRFALVALVAVTLCGTPPNRALQVPLDSKRTQLEDGGLISWSTHFLADNVRVRKAIGLVDRRSESALRRALSSLEDQSLLPPPVATSDPEARLSELHCRRAAFCLWLEHRGALSWSLADYDDDALNLLLGYDSLVSASSLRLRMLELVDHFYHQQTWLKATRGATVAAVFSWARAHLVHRSLGDPNLSDPLLFLQGGPWGTCHDTGDLMATMLNALNIPVYTATYGVDVPGLRGHTYMDVPSEELFIDHCDAPYDRSLVHIRPSEVIYAGPERATYLLSMRTRPADLPRLKLFRDVSLLGRFPNRFYLKAACISPEAMRDTLYAFYECQGTCVPPTTYAAELERTVLEARPGLLRMASERGICAELD
jgi:hypothetical protein